VQGLGRSGDQDANEADRNQAIPCRCLAETHSHFHLHLTAFCKT
jgi:hypothetical protein